MRYSKITISGKICTGKTTLLINLQKELGWPIFRTGQLFRDYIKKNQLELDQVEEQNEKLTKKVDYQVRDMLKVDQNLIVDGWMSGLMADHFPKILKILLVCQDELRYQRFADREKISIYEAEKKVEGRQTNWFKKLEKIYNRNDFIDPKNYDLVVDTSSLSSQEVLKKVLQKIKE